MAMMVPFDWGTRHLLTSAVLYFFSTCIKYFTFFIHRRWYEFVEKGFCNQLPSFPTPQPPMSSGKCFHTDPRGTAIRLTKDITRHCVWMQPPVMMFLLAAWHRLKPRSKWSLDGQTYGFMHALRWQVPKGSLQISENTAPKHLTATALWGNAPKHACTWCEVSVITPVDRVGGGRHPAFAENLFL